VIGNTSTGNGTTDILAAEPCKNNKFKDNTWDRVELRTVTGARVRSDWSGGAGRFPRRLQSIRS
jgi:hypothetical protein